MKFIKDEGLSLLYRVFGLGGRDYLSATVLAGFYLTEPGRLFKEGDMWDRAAEVLGKNRVLDLGMPKPGGEVLVLGRCFPRLGKEAKGVSAFFSLGRMEKRVEVFGNRYFKPGLVNHAYIPPQPFTWMDITWENAFGGPEYDLNPSGKGLAPVFNEKGEKLIPLPNIEDPNHLVTSPDDRPKPAGFGPEGLDWPVRLKNMGTFDRDWLANRWPGLPDDFDFGYFNLAPKDQRIKGYFQGREFFQLRGLHPEKSTLDGFLPGWRCRTFVNRQAGNVDPFTEIAVNLDTVVLVPHMDLGILIWHGTTGISDDEAEDVLHLAAFLENLDDHHQTVDFYHARVFPPEETASGEAEPLPEPEAETLKESEPAPESPEDPVMEEPEIPDEIDAQIKAVEDETQKTLAKLNLMLAGLGLEPFSFEPESVEAAVPPVEAEDHLTPDMHIAKIEEALAETEKALNALIQSTPGAAVEAPVSNLDDLSRDFRTSEEMAAFYREQGIKDPEFFTQIQSLFEEKSAAEAEVAALTAETASIPELEPKAVPEPEPEPGPDVQGEAGPETLNRELVLAMHSRGESLAGMDLSGLDLSSADLSGIDLREAILEKTDFSGSILAGARLDQSILAGADFSDADLKAATMTKVNAGSARMTGCDLTSAKMSRSDFTGADFSKARLAEADLSYGLFRECRFTEADASNMAAPGAHFEKSDLSRAVFVQADLSKAYLTGAGLHDADFSRVKAENSRLSGVQAFGTRFKDACLAKCRAGEGTSFRGADFHQCDLTAACWDQVDLAEANFRSAGMEKAMMNKCLFQGADLQAVYARNADWSKSDFSSAKMRALDMLGGSLRKAVLTESDMRGVNLYGVDLYKCVMGQTRLDGANLDRTLLSLGKGAL